MENPEEAISTYKALIREHRENIKDLRRAIRHEPDKLTKRVYQKTIRWNRSQIRECKAVINRLQLLRTSKWTWIVIFTLITILAIFFPLSVWTFAPLWIPLLIGFVYILIITS